MLRVCLAVLLCISLPDEVRCGTCGGNEHATSAKCTRQKLRLSATTMHRNSTSGLQHVAPLANHGKHPCSECTRVFDMRCNHHFKRIYFHKIIDCLLPLYGTFVQATVHARAMPNATACVLADTDVLMPFLVPLAGPGVAVYDASRCNSLLRPLPAWSIRQNGTILASEKAQQQLIIGGLHPHLRHAWPESRAAEGPVVLVERLASRRWSNAPAIRAALRAWLEPMGAKLSVFDGSQSARVTMELFARQQGVVGYHGAGLANSVFTPRHACVVEVSLWLDATRREPFRVMPARRISSWNPQLEWMTYRLDWSRARRANLNTDWLQHIKLQDGAHVRDRELIRRVASRKSSLEEVWSSLSSVGRDAVAVRWDVPTLDATDLQNIVGLLSSCMLTG